MVGSTGFGLLLLLLLIELGSAHRQLFGRILVLHLPPVLAIRRRRDIRSVCLLLLHLGAPVFVPLFNLPLQLVLIPHLLLAPRIDDLRLLLNYPGVRPGLRGLVLLLLCD